MAGEKMMVVVLLLLIIFLGIAVFIFYIERRLTASEKKLKQLEDIQKKQVNNKAPAKE